MISRSITKGHSVPVSDIYTLDKHRAAGEAAFPPAYFPTFLEGNPNFINTPVRHVENGENLRVVFLVATKSGYILNSPEGQNCQFPKEGFLGRYVIYPEGIHDPTYRGTEPRLNYVCTYWVNYNEIGLIEDETGIIFTSIDKQNLPPKLVQTLNSSDFKSQFFG